MTYQPQSAAYGITIAVDDRVRHLDTGRDARVVSPRVKDRVNVRVHYEDAEGGYASLSPSRLLFLDRAVGGSGAPAPCLAALRDRREGVPA